MNLYADIFDRLLREDISSATAFGPNATGDTGNQFPAQNSKGYNDGDNRPINPYNIILGDKKKKGKKKRTKKIKMQRRTFSGL